MLTSAGVLLLVANSAWAMMPVEVAKLVAEDGVANDFFGFSISLSDDTALIGALRDDDNGVDAGSVHVLTRIGNSWSQQAKLTASDGVVNDHFGKSVAVSGDTVVVGAPQVESMRGRVYVYEKPVSGWAFCPVT